MTVKELIAELQKYDPDCNVEFVGGIDGDGYIDIYPPGLSSKSILGMSQKLTTIYE